MEKNPKQKSPETNHDAERRVRRGYLAFAICLLAVVMLAPNAFATGDPIQTINKLSDFIFGAIKAVGLILLGFGIVQIGLSLKSHDPSQRANGFLTLFGGVVIFFAKELLDLITG